MAHPTSNQNTTNGSSNSKDGNKDSSISVTQARNNSTSQESHGSQTAEEFIATQLQLEADAREALPYQFDTCTRILGPLRQSIFSCLTCNPPPKDPKTPYPSPAGVCYACSIACHGEHTLVELFTHRNFVCDCGTTRIGSGRNAAEVSVTTPCSLQINPSTQAKGNVRDQIPAPGNKYNQNFRNRFCGCGEEYDAQQEKGTMFQCMGLASEEEGGCGEDWWHPECILGIGRGNERREGEGEDGGSKGGSESERKRNGGSNSDIADKSKEESSDNNHDKGNDDIDDGEEEGEVEEEDPPLPPGFPAEDDFDSFICYKCMNVYPWLKRYAGTDGFLPAVVRDTLDGTSDSREEKSVGTSSVENGTAAAAAGTPTASIINVNDTTKTSKRKASSLNDEDDNSKMIGSNQRIKLDIPTEEPTSPDPPSKSTESNTTQPTTTTTTTTINNHTPDNNNNNNNIQSYKHCHYATLPQASPSISLSLFLKPSFRDHFCRCPACFPNLSRHPVLLEEEDVYEPPLSEVGAEGEGLPRGHDSNGAGGLTLRTGTGAAYSNDGRSIRSTTNNNDDVRSTGTGTGSLLDRGEAALMTGMDRVKAIEGVTLYNDLKHKVKRFLAPYAESGRPVSADDIRLYFERLRGD